MSDTGAGTPLTARLSEALRRTHPRLLAETLATLDAARRSGPDEFSMQLQMHIAFCEPGTVHATDPRAKCTMLARQFAARSRPATDPVLERVIDRREDADAAHEIVARSTGALTDYQRGYVDGFEAPANVTARSRPATDPGGLDANFGSFMADAVRRVSNREAFKFVNVDWTALGSALVAEYVRARLSVADGPGPEAIVLVEDQERPLIWVEPRG